MSDEPLAPKGQEGSRMTPKKTVAERQKELQSLLAQPAGQQELREMEFRYRAASGRLRPAKTSVITYIIVHERVLGLVCN